MSEKLTTKDIIHDLEKRRGFKIYLRKKGKRLYSVWYGGSWSFSRTDNEDDLFTARQLHDLHRAYFDNVELLLDNHKKQHEMARANFKDKRNWNMED